MKDLKKNYKMVSDNVKNIMNIYIEQNNIQALSNMDFDCLIKEETQDSMQDCLWCDLCNQLLIEGESEEIQPLRDLSYFNGDDHSNILIKYEKKLAYILDREHSYEFDRLCEDCSSIIDSLFDMKKQAQKLTKLEK